MANELTSAGLTISTVTELIATLTTGLQSIYGSDINIDSSSPDGQKINIIAQSMIDLLEFLVLIYNSFDPDTVSGTLQDARFALNGITRQGGTYTYTPVSVTTDRAVSLIGLSDDPSGSTVFKVSDASNEYYLVTTYAFTSADTVSLTFRAVNMGVVTSALNTIQTIKTVTLGVTSVNNPSAITAQGVDEETDAAYKIRRMKSFMLAATGPADAILAAILQVPGVIDAYVYENATTGTVGSVPAHSLWCIVNGGDDDEVAAAIYSKKSPGAALYGTGSATEVIITRVQGNTITIKFDRPAEEDLYAHFTLTPRVAGTIFDEDAIKEALSAAMVYTLAQSADTNAIITALNRIEPGAIITGCGLSTNDTDFYDTCDTTDSQHMFVLPVANITVIP